MRGIAETKAGFLAERDGNWLVAQVDLLRQAVNGTIEPSTRQKYAQFMTPSATARFMAAMFRTELPKVRLLDPGAGVGSLTAAFVAEMLSHPTLPDVIHVTAYEIDPFLVQYLRKTLSFCREACEASGVEFTGEVRQEDFISDSVHASADGLFRSDDTGYDCVIMNPPYQKIRSASEARHDLRKLGIETSNMYTAFMALAARQLKPGGEFVSITPRSFCNGPYFRPFRRCFLGMMRIQRMHAFESRKQAFKEDDVLQENVILHTTKQPIEDGTMAVSISAAPGEEVRTRHVTYGELVNPHDPNLFIHLVVDERGAAAARRMSLLPASLSDLGLGVSTGRVVDFRAAENLRKDPESGTVPLIYPAHFEAGAIRWPNPQTRKPNAIIANRETQDLLVPAGVYVLVKRFSAKEEPRRVVAAVFDSEAVFAGKAGFENHLNYFHHKGAGLPREVGIGLCLFLNSTLVDTYFRQFSGHTQVNAVDLQSLSYPGLRQLAQMAKAAPKDLTDQEAVDRVIDRVLPDDVVTKTR